jgi:hypothetical protein
MAKLLSTLIFLQFAIYANESFGQVQAQPGVNAEISGAISTMVPGVNNVATPIYSAGDNIYGIATAFGEVGANAPHVATFILKVSLAHVTPYEQFASQSESVIVGFGNSTPILETVSYVVPNANPKPDYTITATLFAQQAVTEDIYFLDVDLRFLKEAVGGGGGIPNNGGQGGN